jgi:D-alanyl-D-alanine endopeptidase (penicillin-binding protein 7)
LKKILIIVLAALCLVTGAEAKQKKHRHHHVATKKVAVTKTKYSSVRTVAPISILAYDIKSHTAVHGYATSVVRPMASLTKLMTAMVSLDANHDLQQSVKYQGRWVPREQLFQRLLIRSDNSVAEFLSQDYPGGRDAFISAMNHKAARLAMLDTHFDDPSGRIHTNVSTAEDVGRMLEAAHGYQTIRRISTYQDLTTTTVVKRRNKTTINVNHAPNTNTMVLTAFPEVVVSKTGFTNPAGYCVGVVVEQNGRTYVVVVMGAHNRYERFDKVKDVMYNHIVAASNT